MLYTWKWKKDRVVFVVVLLWRESIETHYCIFKTWHRLPGYCLVNFLSLLSSLFSLSLSLSMNSANWSVPKWEDTDPTHHACFTEYPADTLSSCRVVLYWIPRWHTLLLSGQPHHTHTLSFLLSGQPHWSGSEQRCATRCQRTSIWTAAATFDAVLFLLIR